MRTSYAQKALTTGIVSIIRLILIALFVLPDNFPHTALPAGYTAVVWYLYTQTQEKIYQKYIKKGAQKASWWAVIGWSLLYGVVTLTAAFVLGLIVGMVMPDF